jgi:hypothetical protein
MPEYVFALWRRDKLVKIFFEVEKALRVAMMEKLRVVRYHVFSDGSVITMTIFNADE